MNNKIGSCCPNCNQFYQLQTPTSKQKGNIPLLLACGHSMCEKCIRNIIQFLEPLDCKICHREMEIEQSDRELLSQNKISLYKLFPVNIYMLGELTFLQMQESEKKCVESDDSFYIDLQGIIESTDNTKGECKECQKPTTKMCQQCSAIVCELCFTKSHKNFVLFKNHDLTNIVPALEPNFCKNHKEKSLDYYCKDCSKSICMDCMMVGGDKSCKNHDVTSIDEINQDFAKEIFEITPQLDETFRRLTKTAVDVGNLLHNIENDTGTTCDLTSLILRVEQHFSKLCSQIQKHKEEVIDILLKLKSSEKDSLHRAKTDIENSLKLSKKVLNSINYMASSNQHKQLNLATLLENAKQILETPWYLSRDENKSEALKVTVNDDLCALITDYIHLEGNVKSVYRLYATAELGEDVELPPPPVAPVFPPELPKDVRQQTKPKVEKKEINNSTPGFFKSVPKYRNKSDSVSSLNSLESDASFHSSSAQRGKHHQRPVVQPVPPFEESQHPKQIYEGSQELIYITHIVDPHNFYVQRSSNQRLVKDMIREFRNATSLPKPSMNHVSEGKVYLMFNKADNMWQRCRVVSIDKTVAQPRIHVFCIDFGSTEVTTIDNLRLLPPARVQSPYPLAINCSLANCEPIGGSWSSEDSLLIQNIIDNKQAVIYIRHIRSSSNYSVKFECDVTTLEDGVNIAQALVFHERAKMPNPKLPYPKIIGIAEKPKLFMNHNDFKPKSIEEVNITHIVSPDKFFVRKRHLQQIYDNLCEDLDHEYSLSDNTGTVYLPEIGMVCAVNLEKCGVESVQGWARGIVVELPGRGRARLLLPDTGALLLAHWSALRHIRQRFITIRALATECYLAGVTPLKKKWSPASVALLQKFEDRLLELHVEDCRNRSTIGVSLYDRADPDNEICINNEMIKHKFAVTFGLYRFHNDNVEEQFVTNKSPVKPKRVSEPPIKKLETKKKENKPVKPETSDDDLEAKDKGPLRLEAKILNYQSPSLLYVSLIHQQKTFNELFEKIQKYYSTKKSPGRSTWSVGDKCCTFCSLSQTWRRAVIIEIEKEYAKVFYSDFACIESVPITNLRELSPEFTSIGDAAIKCHLCGVIPAVGDEWPSVTKEYLKELLEVYKRTFITKLGNFKNKSMPIEIWVYHTVQGGALEPNKSEWRCLNTKIIEQGLGIPDKNFEVTTSEPVVEEDGDETLSFLNIKGSVREWLQLEPMPTKPLNIEPTVDSTPDDNSDVQINQIDFISDWLPPEPLPNKEFMGMPTYIDNDGIIYLHDATQQDTLDMIRRALQHRFKNPDPKAKYTKWTVGEPCVAMFFLDNQFYRGRIVEVNQDTSSCLIHYIDYGNEEMCEFVNLRKSIALHQIPTQAHKCILDRIRPINGSWDRQALDYLHKTVVEKQCFIKITQESTGDIVPIELKCNKLSINDHLVDFEMAEYTDGTQAVIHKYAPLPTKTHDNMEIIEDSGPDYILADEDDIEQISTSFDSFKMESIQGKDWNEIMEEEDATTLGKYITYGKFSEREFLSNIIFINDINLLELTVIHDDETNIMYEEMFKKIQEEASSMTPLNGIYENKACLALYEEDEQWYRASILQYSETKNKVKVKYVDFGNIGVVCLADVREIPEAYTELPPASIHVKLYGITVKPDVDVATISQEYSKTFLNKGPFFTKVIDYEDTIPLVELRDDNSELVYDSLIKSGLFEKKNVD